MKGRDGCGATGALRGCERCAGPGVLSARNTSVCGEASDWSKRDHCRCEGK